MKINSIPIIEIGHINNVDDNLKKDFIISDSNEDILQIMSEHPLKMNSILVGICVQGEGKIQVNLNSFHLKEKSIIIFSPGTIIHCHQANMSNDFHLKYISFSPEFISSFEISYIYSETTQYPYFKATEKEYNLLLKIFSDLEEKYNNRKHSFRREVIQHTLLASSYEFCQIHIDHFECGAETNISRNERLIQDFYSLVFKYYKQQHDTAFYADKLHLSPKYLSALIKEQTGKTVSEWIFSCIIIEAKALLKSSQMTIQELAYYFGYADATSFGKFFKKQAGLTPKKYRLS